jgi:hypothetical protein
MLILLVVSCLLFGQAYFQERGERRRLEGRIALLEQLMNKFNERSATQGTRTSSQKKVPPASPQPVNVTLRQQEKEVSVEARVSEIQIREDRETDPQSVKSAAEISVEPPAKIDDVKATSLEEEREGFRLDFKLVNSAAEPISGNVAIIAFLRPPHQPRYVSFPSMNLVDGMPVKLKKSVGYSIRYFKYVTGRFYFPFSYSESFRILVYDRDEQLILDSTVPAEDVSVYGLVSEEPVLPLTPLDPSLSS